MVRRWRSDGGDRRRRLDPVQSVPAIGKSCKEPPPMSSLREEAGTSAEVGR